MRFGLDVFRMNNAIFVLLDDNLDNEEKDNCYKSFHILAVHLGKRENKARERYRGVMNGSVTRSDTAERTAYPPRADSASGTSILYTREIAKALCFCPNILPSNVLKKI